MEEVVVDAMSEVSSCFLLLAGLSLSERRRFLDFGVKSAECNEMIWLLRRCLLALPNTPLFTRNSRIVS